MIWTQLFGRLQHLKEMGETVQTFLRDIFEDCPKPWLRPSEGLFNIPSANLSETFQLDGRYICHIEEGTDILFLIHAGSTNVKLCRFKYGHEELSAQTICMIHDDNFVQSAAFSRTGSSIFLVLLNGCLLYTSPSPRDQRGSRMPSSA